MKKYIFAIVFISNLFAQVDYNTEIQTIFNANCTSCHINGGAYQQGLDLSSYDSLMAGSNNGAVIVPGDHANSLLWQKVNSGDMPPQNNPDLNSDEVDLIAQWIDEGALEIVGCVDGEVELWGVCYNIEETDSLDLSESGLTGSIPPEIGNLINLTELWLGYNQLSGSIPPEIGNLTNLTELRLDYNQLTGSIPSEIGNLTNLEWLTLNNNQLTDTIPNKICNFDINWSSSTYFRIFNNQLCPPYPSCIEDYVGDQDTSGCGQVSIIDETLPMTYNLHNAYPNPFNPVTTLRYDLPEDAMVNITIYDMMGRQVKTLVNGSQTAGFKSIQWNATNDKNRPVSAGLYLYTIQAGEFKQTKKMVLLK